MIRGRSCCLKFSHCFPYRHFGNTVKPVIEAEVEYNNNCIIVPMLIDSGAESSALPAEFGLALGIDFSHIELRRGRSAAGTGTFMFYRVEGVKLVIVKGEIEIISPVNFSEQLNDFGYGLLGREVVFEQIRIAFRERYHPGMIYIGLETNKSETS